MRDAAGDPVPALRVEILPYDPDGLLDSLERLAGAPKPAFPDLERELEGYTPPDAAAAERLIAQWRRTREPVEALADSLRGMDRDGPGYAESYARFRRLYEALRLEEASLERQYRSLSSADTDLARRAAAAADSLRQWEASAFADYETAVRQAEAAAGRVAATGTTDVNGRITIELAPGRWWLVARQPHPTNPFQERYWTVGFSTNRLVPVVVPISHRNVTLRWRH